MLNIEEWITKSTNGTIKEFRQAIHTVLVAISNSRYLQTRMIMKGGVLLVIKFKGLRHTRDIDFSTSEKYDKNEKDKFIITLKENLLHATELLDYGLECRIQSFSVNPSRENPSYPTLTLKIAYAPKGSKSHKRLLAGNSSTVLRIDYSYNETSQKIDFFEFQKGRKIRAYSISDLVGEKYRAIIQQKSRNRNRRQDAYDIYCLIKNGELERMELKKLVHASLIIKAKSRNLLVDMNSLDDEEIIKRSKAEYKNLAQEIEGELPSFDEVYLLVKKYYISLPWDEV